jgi:hypothetical protein
MLPMKTLLRMLAALTFGAGCGSSSADHCDPRCNTGSDGAAEDVTHPSDAKPTDAHPKDGTTHDGAHDGGSGDGSSHDGPTDGPPSMTDAGGVQCFEMFSSGDLCGYSSSTMAGYMCPGGFSPGPCPSTGLFGCCVDRSTDGGVTAVGAVCYYSPDAGAIAMGVCESKPGETWSTMSP